MILIDSYGWIEYFGDGPLADSYAPFIEHADDDNTLTPTIVVYEVYMKIKSIKGEEKPYSTSKKVNTIRRLCWRTK